MDCLPCSHSTTRSHGAPAAFLPHPKLPRLLVPFLADRYRKFLARGDIATADTFARLAANDAAAGVAHELLGRRRRGTNDYLRPTIDAQHWRDPQSRRRLPAHLLSAYRLVARNESRARACFLVELLSDLAKMTTQPDARCKAEIDGHRRSFEAERHAWLRLREAGFADLAKPYQQRALRHLVLADMLAREWRPNQDELLFVTCHRLTRHFGFRGDRIASALVTVALKLDRQILPRHARHVVKFVSK